MIWIKSQYLTEAAKINKGFKYEWDLYDVLVAADLSPAGFSPAGGGHGPDGMFLYKGKKFNYEIKLDQAADYGQVELRYKNGSWDFGGKNQEAKDLYNNLGVMDFVRKSWGAHGAPRKETVGTKDFSPDDVKHDYKHFTDAYMKIPSSVLAAHYAKKGTYYIQVGKSGFYHMDKDIANIGTQKFDATLKLRIRIKRRGSQPINKYGFLTALKIDKKAGKSKFDMDKNLDFLR